MKKLSICGFLFLLSIILMGNSSADSSEEKAEELRAARADLREAERRMEEASRQIREQTRDAQRQMKEANRQIRNQTRDAQRELRKADKRLRKLSRESSRRAIASMKRGLRGNKAIVGLVMDSNKNKTGVQLMAVTPGAAADKAGLKSGDVLLRIRGESLSEPGKSSRPFHRAIALLDNLEDGEPIEVVYERKGKENSVTLIAESHEIEEILSSLGLGMNGLFESLESLEGLESIEGLSGISNYSFDVDFDSEEWERAMSKISENAEFYADFVSDIVKPFGEQGYDFKRNLIGNDLELVSLNSGLGAYFGAESGVLVLEADPNNQFNIRSGDVLLSIGDRKVQSPPQAMRILRSYDAGDSLEIVIMRERSEKKINHTIGDS